MQILKLDKKTNFISLKPEILDDLWHLERVIEYGDLVKGQTDRKIKGKEGEKTFRQKIFVELEVNSIEFHKFSGLLRVSGIIMGGKPEEFIELKAHQSLEIELGQRVDLVKKDWKDYLIDRLKKAEIATKKKPLLLLVLDDEGANFAWLKEFTLESLTGIKSGKSGKQFKEEKWQEKFFNELFKKIKEWNPEKLVIAGPGFVKEDFRDYLKEKNFKGKLFIESVNNIGKPGFNELIKSGVVEKITQEMEFLNEAKIIERVFEELGKDSGLAEYGLNECENAIKLSAVETLIVLDSFLFENREKIENLMKKTEKTGGNVKIVSHESDAGKRLEGLGNIAAILRYKLN